MAKPGPKPDEDDVRYDTSTGSRVPGIVFGIAATIPGIYYVLRGFGLIHVRGRPSWWTDPSEVLIGATIAGAGLWFFVLGLELSKRPRRAAWHAIWVVLAAVYTWAITIIGFDALAYTSVGPMSGVRFWRALVVAFDFYVLYSIFDHMLDELGSAPDAKKRNKLAYTAGCIVLAFTLELTGGLAKVYAGLGLKQPGPAATIGVLQSNHLHPEVPDLPLAEFAGDWYGVFQKRMPGSPGHGAGAITRIHVRVENGVAQMQLWRWCPPRECDAGNYPAIIESRRRGTVVALHAVGTTDGMDWIVSLSTQKDHMLLEDQRVRGKDMNTRRQSSDWMSKQPP